MFFQFLINGIIKGGIYAVCALGFGLVYNTTKIFHIAYAALYVIGTYIMYACFSIYGLNIIISCCFSLIITSVISMGIEHFVYQPLVKKGGALNSILISSIGVMIILINLIAIIFGNETQVISNEISNILHWYNTIITYNQIIQLIVSLIIISTFMIVLKYSSFGLAIRALRDDAILTDVFGYNIKRFRLALFAISGILVSISSNLVSIDVGFDPYIGMPMLLNTIVALTIGGIGTFNAAILGGYLLGLTQSIAVYFFDTKWENAITFIILLFILIIRPQGISGEKQRNI